MKNGLRTTAPGAMASSDERRAASAADEAAAGAIARQTMSPFCPGRTLADCPSEYAAEWRRDIRQMIAEGRTAAEIQDELERRAGANLSGSPARDTSYWVPAAFALLGVAVLGGIFMRLRRKSAPDTPSESRDASDASDASESRDVAGEAIDDARLDAELAAEEDDDR